MQHSSVLDDQQAKADLEHVLKVMKSSTLLNLFDQIDSQYSHSCDVDEIDDGELHSHILFLCHAQTYLLLKFGIKHSDIDLICRVFDQCTVYFHGSGQSNYIYKMLYLQCLLVNSTPELQKAILSNSLVNLRGHSNSWFEMDWLVEFHNGDMKILYHARWGSTINLEQLFENYALSSAYLANLQKDIYQIFNVHWDNEHTDKSAQRDIVAMAWQLSIASVRFKAGRTVQYPAIDTVAIGTLRIASDALPKFNSMDCLQGFSEIKAEALAEVDNSYDRDIQDFFVLKE